MEFAWDERKNRLNQRKHRISFETAVLVFDDPCHLSTQDREIGGRSAMANHRNGGWAHLLLVAHTLDEDADSIRILSARKATRRERNLYAQGN